MNSENPIAFNFEAEGHFMAIVPTEQLAVAIQVVSGLTWDRGVTVKSMLKAKDIPGSFNLYWTPKDKKEEEAFRKAMLELGGHEVCHGERYEK